MNNIIDGVTFKDFVKFAHNNLHANAKIVDELNVFPIPDGDTGANMGMTLGGGYCAIENFESNNVGEIASKCAEGMLLNARGNSGVILSQLFYGFAEAIKDKESLTISELVFALGEGVKRGYLAVDKPAEGTILTVAREGYEYVRDFVDANTTVENFVVELLNATNKSVQDTPNKLDVLKKAGVVDSGGAGLYYIYEGINKGLHGKDFGVVEPIKCKQQEIDYSKFNENSVLEFGYCSEVLLQLTKSKIDVDKFNLEELKAYLNTIGDSIVASQTGYVVKIHVHTFEPYKLLQHCQQFGEFLKIKIENMTIQHNEANVQNNFQPVVANKAERKRFGLVTVATGEGLIETFKNFGADVVINGGQTNNPSTEEFINAFEQTNAEIVFVLPNNSNIILTANQAAEMYKSSKIYVVESRSIGDGYAALSLLDYSSDDVDQILNNLKEAVTITESGAITRAIRTTKVGDINVTKDDYVAISGKTMLTSTPTKIRTIYELVNKLHPETKDYCVLIYGKGMDSAEKELTLSYIHGKYPALEVYEIEGGQEIYDLFIVLN